jgi:hypothetical protein
LTCDDEDVTSHGKRIETYPRVFGRQLRQHRWPSGVRHVQDAHAHRTALVGQIRNSAAARLLDGDPLTQGAVPVQIMAGK